MFEIFWNVRQPRGKLVKIFYWNLSLTTIKKEMRYAIIKRQEIGFGFYGAYNNDFPIKHDLFPFFYLFGLLQNWWRTRPSTQRIEKQQQHENKKIFLFVQKCLTNLHTHTHSPLSTRHEIGLSDSGKNKKKKKKKVSLEGQSPRRWVTNRYTLFKAFVLDFY